MALGRLIEFVVKGRQLKCEACQGQFTCGPMPGCWCAKADLPEETRRQLRSLYGDCLCPDCLEKAAQNPPTP